MPVNDSKRVTTTHSRRQVEIAKGTPMELRRTLANVFSSFLGYAVYHCMVTMHPTTALKWVFLYSHKNISLCQH